MLSPPALSRAEALEEPRPEVSRPRPPGLEVARDDLL
jgi:hypothetical protein